MKSTPGTRNRSREMSPLRRHRIAKGYTVSAWAELLGVSITTVSNWELGKQDPWPDKYARIAELLGITPLEVTELVCPSQPTAA